MTPSRAALLLRPGWASRPLLLDAITVAPSAAYGLRKLRSSYVGPAIRVRRSSDNAEQDIGFYRNGVDSSALMSFAGSGNAFVTTWYDQSTNGRGATQGTNGNQPSIVTAGALNLRNSLPAIFASSTQSLSVPTAAYSTSGDGSICGVWIPTGAATTPAVVTILSSPADNPEIRLSISTSGFYRAYWNGAYVINGVAGPTAYAVHAFVSSISGGTVSVTAYGNNTSFASGSLAKGTWTSISSINLGLFPGQGNAAFNGSEFLFFTSALSSADRNTIASSQGAYYGITVA